MSYQVYALRYAEKDLKECQFFFREASQAPLTLHYYLWVILGGPHPLVVDTGFAAAEAQRREARKWVSPAEMLARVGVKAAEVPVTLISHLHWDHWGGRGFFPGSQFWVQREELAFWTGVGGQYEVFRMFAIPESLAELVRLNYAGRVRLVEGEVEVLPGVTAHWVGGHTAGLQIVTSLPQMLRGFDRIDELAGASRLVVVGHDPEVARRFDEVEPGIVRIA